MTPVSAAKLSPFEIYGPNKMEEKPRDRMRWIWAVFLVSLDAIVLLSGEETGVQMGADAITTFSAVSRQPIVLRTQRCRLVIEYCFDYFVSTLA